MFPILPGSQLRATAGIQILSKLGPLILGNLVWSSPLCICNACLVIDGILVLAIHLGVEFSAPESPAHDRADPGNKAWEQSQPRHCEDVDGGYARLLRCSNCTE